MQHRIRKEAQFFEGLWGSLLVASAGKIAHDLVSTFDDLVHPTIHFHHFACWGKMKDEDVALLISHLQST